ncbi:ABC transporter ATP-binding protein [Shewanella sp. Choline-02u-19]|jgi:ABC-2 type transport system ATP-binding protein|uniref:ABC transporter ATP-binding protein n=1 Tax=unclassified Shewanella TaxID=196818 RepID=UPI000C33C69D|nr:MULTISPECIES: ABC transporter ATP-binding protein [unclassified Shewanella]PKG59121.1 ABC transporter ATP-binding protein [Shewanella sp. GutDb-MelDb]PKG72527.1 ABC transporter ATP-binding protein [Shewanella sp. GutCb]PKH57096.1 ABC transporter ATP-binding protein [Shewanella sp. Bg11-22]PKI27893.1 ABC transporter ATP-binding protein [Shewanella sp. Choline-02u-19]
MRLIECKGLSKSYGSKQALRQVDLNLEAGEPIALVGPNGAGKTTLFSLLCGYITPTDGEVSILGHTPGDSALLGRVSSLPQDATLDPNFDILTQLMLFATLQGFSKSDAKSEALRVLSLVDLADCASQKPKSLSHGMAKRVAIAQSLIGSPELVLLDEPTAGLDPANAKKIRELVRTLSNKTTFIISSHNLDELEKLCGQVLYLEQGQLTQSVSMNDNLQNQYITLTMQQCDADKVVDAVMALPDINSIEKKQHNEFLIKHNSEEDYAIESALFALFKHNNWQYKAILKGRTLEDKLFS